MLQYFFMLITALAPPLCKVPATSAPLATPRHQAKAAPADRTGPLERSAERRDDRRARRGRNEIDRTLRNFFRSLRHRRAERRGHRSAGLLERFRDRRGRRRHQDAADLADGQVTVPHEDPVDLPLYPTPNQ